jgi:hemolysin activation/secretion protein
MPASSLSVGGQYSVRGFKEQYLSGNRGGYWRNELTWQWMTIPGVGTLSATGALDARTCGEPEGITDGGTLTGTSLGLELAGRWLSQSLTVAMPLSYPDRLNPDKQVFTGRPPFHFNCWHTAGALWLQNKRMFRYG